ncbi:porin family protein [Aurantibacter sp.]|uniref:porin family protein n=1 Tax=Aurantibacter sp. TaxID=2807103 RepID=UPI00326634A9
MKKVIFLAVVLLALGAEKMKAQVIVQDKTISNNNALDGEIRFGAKAGLNISTFINKDYFDVTPKPGGFIGGLAEIPITEGIYAQPELLISFQGADIGPGDLNLIYLHVPLMGKYHITDEFAAELGPQLSLVLSDNASDYINNGEELKTNTFQVAFNLGGGYRLNESLYFQARFSVGLSKTVQDSTVKNGIIQIGAAYFF